MKQDIFFCSVQSSRAEEQAVGTASAGDSWLLLEYPHPWGVKAFQESNLSREIKLHLKAALKSVPRSRLLFIKQDHPPAEFLSLFVVRSRELDSSVVRYELRNYEQLLELNLASALAGDDEKSAEIWERPLFLVCTHGKRDKCCAKFGFAIYKSVRDFAGDASVWQSSHVGGDRFAANVICFPDGLFYAHVTDEAGQNIVNSYRERKVVLNNFRGRACYPPPIQAAEFFARTESGLSGVSDLKFLSYDAIKPSNWRVRFISTIDAKIHEVYLTGELSEFQNRLTCHSSESRRVVQYSLSEYRALSDLLEYPNAIPDAVL
jgi:hypothetical protein